MTDNGKRTYDVCSSVSVVGDSRNMLFKYSLCYNFLGFKRGLFLIKGGRTLCKEGEREVNAKKTTLLTTNPYIIFYLAQSHSLQYFSTFEVITFMSNHLVPTA